MKTVKAMVFSCILLSISISSWANLPTKADLGLSVGGYIIQPDITATGGNPDEWAATYPQYAGCTVTITETQASYGVSVVYNASVSQLNNPSAYPNIVALGNISLPESEQVGSLKDAEEKAKRWLTTCKAYYDNTHGMNAADQPGGGYTSHGN